MGQVPPFVVAAMYGKSLMLSGRITEEPTREIVIAEFTKDVNAIFDRYEAAKAASTIVTPEGAKQD
jgi:hypothetical protein